jgi:pyruvate/2-oxoglutarate dehydrogenase complex dihydrolipoamide acyltransferase (E2) component
MAILPYGKYKKVHLSVTSRPNGPGQSFSVGEVLLEIETDKAQMHVGAQDDGVLARIVFSDSSKNVKVGKTIAMLAQQGDDLSTVEVPKENDGTEAATKEAEA